MVIRTLLASLAITVGGCGFTPQGDAARSAVKELGAQAFDEGLENAEWFICSGASVGSIQRRYGTSMDRWNALCGHPRAF